MVFTPGWRPLLTVSPLIVLLLAAPAGASEIDLNGLYVGTWIDKGRNMVNRRFKLRLKHDGDAISGNTVDKTIWVKGKIVASRIELEWDHSSGEYGKGYFDILDGGKRISGGWDSAGSGRFYGEWDLAREQ